MTRTLDEATTSALLTRVNSAYRTRTDELLLTALAVAVRRCAGPGAVRVDVEGHGRDGAGLADVLGWFTTLTPVRLDLTGVDPDRDPGGAVTRIRERLRGLPGRPGDYGLLRYGTAAGWPGDPERVPPADILFNYLGRLDGIGGGLVRIPDRQDGRSRDPENRRPYPVEVDCRVLDGRFEVTWTFDGTVDRARMERLAGDFDIALRDLVRHGTADRTDNDGNPDRRGGGTGAGSGGAPDEALETWGYRPADFPLAELTDEMLARILAAFRRGQPRASEPAETGDEEGTRPR